MALRKAQRRCSIASLSSLRLRVSSALYAAQSMSDAVSQGCDSRCKRARDLLGTCSSNEHDPKKVAMPS